jgi:hypothetical protein
MSKESNAGTGNDSKQKGAKGKATPKQEKPGKGTPTMNDTF